MFYFTLLSIIMLVFSFTKKEQVYALPFFVVVLFVLQAFRGESVGTDTPHYKAYFDIIENGYYLPVEPGWIFLNEVVLFFNGSYETLLIVVAIITLFPIYYVIKRHSPNPMLSLFLFYTLYFYFYSFNISRQVLAVAIVLLAYTFLKKEKKWIYLLCICAASLFHTSALIALPLLFVNRIPDSKSIYITGIITTYILGIFGTEYIFSLVPHTFYANYFDSMELGNLLGNALYLLILNGFFLFIWASSRDRGIYFKIFFICILISNLLIRIPLGSRVIMFFAIIQILFLPYSIYNSNKQFKPLITSVIVLYAYILFFRVFGYGEILPYVNTLLK